LLVEYFKFIFSREKKLIAAIRNLTGIMPRNIALYKLALSHISAARHMPNGKILTNERLEFLGDAILGAVIAEHLFRKFPYRDEGFLTEMRSKIVSRENLKSMAMKMGLDKLIIKDTTPGSYKSMYGDAFEALIGAIYMDKGYAAVKKFILERMVNLHLDLNELEATEKNYKSRLLNWAQRHKHHVVFESSDDPANSRLIKVRLLINDKEVATASDFSKKKAEQLAAEIHCKAAGI
jgi:ribonuclease-3